MLLVLIVAVVTILAILAAVGVYAISAVNKDVVSGVNVINPSGNKTALVAYQEG